MSVIWVNNSLVNVFFSGLVFIEGVLLHVLPYENRERHGCLKTSVRIHRMSFLFATG